MLYRLGCHVQYHVAFVLLEPAMSVQANRVSLATSLRESLSGSQDVKSSPADQAAERRRQQRIADLERRRLAAIGSTAQYHAAETAARQRIEDAMVSSLAELLIVSHTFRVLIAREVCEKALAPVWDREMHERAELEDVEMERFIRAEHDAQALRDADLARLEAERLEEERQREAEEMEGNLDSDDSIFETPRLDISVRGEQSAMVTCDEANEVEVKPAGTCLACCVM